MKRLQRGILIALEGIDGVGKSTLAKALFEELCDSYSVILTKEPGATPLGKEIRTILQQTSQAVHPIAEALLFGADRAQHIADVVKPALENGSIVISDRMADSSRAYQGFGRGLKREHIENVIEWAMDGIKPDIIIYVTLDWQTAWNRIVQRRQAITRFEGEEKNFFKRVVEGFEKIYAKNDQVIRIDGRFSEHEVREYAIKALKKKITSLQ